MRAQSSGLNDVELRWRVSAYEDRVAIYDYIEKDSPAAAVTVDDRILNTVDLLHHFPEMGRNGRRSGTREFPVRGTPYIIAYRIQDEVIEIIRIVHGAQRWPHFGPNR